MTEEKSYRITPIDNGAIVYTTYAGAVTLKVLMDSSRERTSDPEYRDAKFIVNDIRDADVCRVTADDVREMAARVRKVLEQRPDTTVVMVVKDNLAYGMSRIWRGKARAVSKDLHVVYSKEEAFKIINRIRAERGL
ncbi:MAG: hypothetical protein JXR76_02510 [Deltaproteobacteria bacterium]|nr:hypothetical protein [Deltaproteobacteria bacterium]